jgi:hypothetical protein
LREFVAALRLSRRPIALIAAGFLVLQGLLATAAPGNGAAGFPGAVICHSEGGFGADPSGDETKAVHACCAACAACSLVIEPPRPAAGAAPVPEAAVPVAASGRMVAIAARAIRAGPSQGPPLLV